MSRFHPLVDHVRPLYGSQIVSGELHGVCFIPLGKRRACLHSPAITLVLAVVLQGSALVPRLMPAPFPLGSWFSSLSRHTVFSVSCRLQRQRQENGATQPCCAAVRPQAVGANNPVLSWVDRVRCGRWYRSMPVLHSPLVSRTAIGSAIRGRWRFSAGHPREEETVSSRLIAALEWR